MKKYVASLALVVLVAGCNTATEEPAAPVEPVAPSEPPVTAVTPEPVEEPIEAVEPQEQVGEVAAGATTDNLEFDDDVSQFEGWIADMARWQSYKATLDNYDTYFEKESNIDREHHEQTEYIEVSGQYFYSSHTIGFQNSHIDRYIIANEETGEYEGVERFSMEEWQTVEDAAYYFKNIAPARADMLQSLIHFSQERLVSEDGQTLTLNILPEKSKEAFNKVSQGINFVVTDAELTDEVTDQLAMDESEVGMVSAVIYADGTQITGYDIDIYVNFVDPQQTDHYTYSERFSDVNTLETTTTPEDL